MGVNGNGCCGKKACSYYMIMGGVVSVICAILGSVVIPNVKAKQLCENVCIPLPSDEQWMQDAWKYNTNTSRNPIETMRFILYNITNAADVYNGVKPILEEIGPFVYQMYREKYDIVYHDNFEKVSFKELKRFHFRPDLSGNVTEGDILTSVTLPAVGSLQVGYFMDPVNFWPTSYGSIAGWCGGENPLPGPDPCLFTQMTARQIIWGYDSYDLFAGNNLFFGGTPFFDVQFSLWFNDTNSTVKDFTDNNQHHFGLGGKCVVTNASFGGGGQYPLPLCVDPVTANATLTTTMYTGHNSANAEAGLANINKYAMWMGNTSLDIWESPVSVAANDQYQFTTDIDTSATLGVLDEKLMRTVDLKYQQTVTLLDVDMYRFVPSELMTGSFTFNYCKNVPCGGHGKCSEAKKGQCDCDKDYAGALCTNYIGTTPNATCGNSTECGHGNCSNITKKCECADGWFGDSCDVTPCDGVQCGPHGQCQPNTGTCKCDDMYYGFGCWRFALPGTADISEVSTVTYGSNTPMKMSELYMRGVDKKYRDSWFECVNCPDVDKMTDADTGVYVDIEPNTGKTLRGAKRGQLNIYVGQEYIFGKCSDAIYPWACVPEMLLPIMHFQEYAEMSEQNSQIVKDGLTLLSLANSSLKVCKYALPVIGVIFLFIGIRLCRSWRKDEDGDDYQTL